VEREQRNQDLREVVMTESTQSRIVVGVDGSQGSKDALRWAAHLAPTLGATVEAVSVWQFVASFGWSRFGGLPAPHPELEKDLQATVDEVFGPTRPVEITTRVVEGDPAGALLAVARDAAMIVVGSRGHGQFTGLLIGAVSARVAEHATCPVLVVHGGPPEGRSAA
jgi:nucleotide-binding universal stress UspA family protein